MPLFGCVPGTDDDGSVDPSDGEASDTEAPASGGTSTGSDSTTDDPSLGTDEPSGDGSTSDGGAEPVALGDDVLLFVREVDSTTDELWAYDLATDQAERVIDIGDAEITSIAIAPDRTRVAFASDYQSVDYQASQSIFELTAGADGESELRQLMPAIPKPIGVSAGYSQRVDELAWHPDGGSLWFGHGFFFDIGQPGGGALGRVDAATGGFELFVDQVGDCSVNSSPSPSPDGSSLFAVRGVCIDGAHEGLVAFDLPIAAEPTVVVPSGDTLFVTPQWIADGSGVVFGGRIDYDSDGDGTNDVFGDALLLLDTTTGDQYVVVAPSADAYIWDFAMAPDASRFAVCVSGDGGRNLLLVDYTGAEVATRWLTDDGVSCSPAW